MTPLPGSRAALVALAVAAALHLGFQLAVTVLVYPALARVAPGDWSTSHDAHSRRIVPLVGLTYAALLGSGVWALAAAPLSVGLVVALVGAATALLTTTFAAAPLHGRLGGGHDPALVTRLLRVDRVRAAGAAVCLVGAVGAVLT
ncbi:hypothetical protein [Lapillicoccus sp.]|uniref:hypothetical protein n=1 Tax=Lapillicoccus sp. TaxID=1909287 RepID=UPI0025DDCE78|nr:hypothetical protein [Lapillicoccus sp.]